MRIGVFGNEYVGDIVPFPDPNQVSWIHILRTRGYKLDTFAQEDAGLYYSYSHFMEQYKSCDRIIVLVSGLKCIQRFRPRDRDDEATTADFISSIEQLMYCIENKETVKKDSPGFDTDKLLDAYKLYYEFLYDPTQDYLMNKLMIKDIISLRPDTLLIPTTIEAKHLIKEYRKTPVIMKSISDLGENKDLIDRRYGRISKKHHEIFADVIEHWIKTGEYNISLDMFKEKK